MEQEQAAVEGRRKKRTRLLVLFSVAAGVALFLGANAHLLHVAFTSQPDCVPHSKASEESDGSYRAAKSAC